MPTVDLVRLTRYIRFETDEGAFGFRYAKLTHFKWEPYGREIDSQAIHFFFEMATVSVVGNDLKKIFRMIEKEKVAAFRLGESTEAHLPRISYIGVFLKDETNKKNEAINRGET